MNSSRSLELALAISLLSAIPLRAVEPNIPSSFPQELEAIRAEANLPALGAAACIDGKIVEIATTGTRRMGGKVAVTNDDLWHLGSITKSMTSTLAGVLVDEGKLKWNSTVGEVLSGLGNIKPEWKGVTLEQLLQHRAGAPEAPPPNLWADAWKAVGRPEQQRLSFVKGLLSGVPQYPPGTAFHYSNQGYSIAGTMMERVTGKPWETLMQERIFKPLGMKSAGFGAPGTPGRDDQPVGHVGKDSLKPVEVGPQADNPAAIGPGGIVHCSLSDLARYAEWHTHGGGPLPLKPDTFARLHEPPSGGDYAMGWHVLQRDWAGGTTLTHNGTNTMWFAVIWISPSKHAAFVAATNAGNEKAAGADDKAVSALIQRTLK